ncbi:DUF1566 domain-containing protein [Thermodesulfobacteriota bacterium]
MVFVQIDVADCTERVYYSIQISSFRDLNKANRHVNALKKKEKIVFWKKVTVPGKGEFYRVYLGKYANRDDAFEYWKQLREDKTVIYCGIHEFKEKIESKDKTHVSTQSVSNRPGGFPAVLRIPAEDRFVDNLDGTITDRQTNLMWIKNGWRLDFFSALTWWNARKKCDGFRHGGYTNWRLPTIEEWRTLIDVNHQSPALVEPNPFVNIISHMPYWSTTEYTYNKDHTCEKECPFHSYTVMLYSGSILHQKKSERAFVLPVRNLK